MALKGLKVLEFAGLAPVPFCGMIFSDFGAQVTHINRIGSSKQCIDLPSHNKRSLNVNLKHPDGVNIVKAFASDADILIEPYRPGVMEKLGLGPRLLREANPGLIYARLTGYGQFGPYANKAGHGINFMGLSGILSQLGVEDNDGFDHTMMVNLLTDFAGGGLLCSVGILAALSERQRTGKGQIVDSSMVEGISYLGTWAHEVNRLANLLHLRDEIKSNNFVHYYTTYRTKDGKYMTVGAVESKFYRNLLRGLGLSEDQVPQFGLDTNEYRALFKARFEEKTRDEWCRIFQDLDACVAPLLTMEETLKFDHNVQRGSFKSYPDSDTQSPIPAPRLSNHMTNPLPQINNRESDVPVDQMLQEVGFDLPAIKELLNNAVIESHT